MRRHVILGGVLIAIATLAALWRLGPSSGSAPRAQARGSSAEVSDARLEPETSRDALAAPSQHADERAAGREAIPPTLIVHVVDERGAPHTRFSVVAEPFDDEGRALPALPRHTIDAPDGRWRTAELAPGLWRLRAEMRGMWSAASEIELARDAEPLEPVEIVLVVANPASIVGRVVRSNGSPAAGAFVACWVQGASKLDTRTTTCDGEGRFAFANVGLGRRFVQAAENEDDAACTLAPSAVSEVELGADAALGDTVLTLRSGREITGSLCDENGAPLAGGVVSIEGSGLRSSRAVRRVTCDERGVFRCGGLPRGIHRVTRVVEPRARQSGTPTPTTESADADLREAETANVVLGSCAEARVVIRGRLLGFDASRGPATVEVCRGLLTSGALPSIEPSLRADDFRFESSSESLPSVSVDALGHYELRATSGALLLRVRQAERTLSSRALVAPAGSALVVDFDVRGGSIAGVVIGPSGAPLPGIVVDVLDWTPRTREDHVHGRFPASGTTDAQGRFRVDGITSAECVVHATLPQEIEGRVRSLSIARVAVPVSGVAEVVLRFDERTRLEVVCRGTTGERAAILVKRPGGSFSELRDHAVDEHGRATIEGLPSGRWVVSAIATGRASAPVEVELSADAPAHAELELAALGSLEITLRDEYGDLDRRDPGLIDAHGEPVVVPWIRPRTLVDGDWRWSDSTKVELRAGDYTLLVGSERIPVRVEAGATRSLELRVKP